MIKKLSLFIIFVLSLQTVYAICDDIKVDVLYLNDTKSCENLDTIRITDIDCDPFPPPGNCWQGYNKAELALHDGISADTNSIMKLDPSVASFSWKLGKCTEEKEYSAEVVFDENCKKTLTLDLNAGKDETLPEPDLTLDDNSIESGASKENINDVSKEKEMSSVVNKSKTHYLVWIVVFVAVLFIFFLFYFVFFKKK